MKIHPPRLGWRGAWLCCLCAGVPYLVHAQGALTWSDSASALGMRGTGTVDPAGPLSAAGMAQSMRAPAVAPGFAAQTQTQTQTPTPVPWGDTLDIQSAVHAALQWHPLVGSALSDLAQRGSLVTEARAGYMPAVRGGVNVGRRSATQRSPSASLSVSQMLYDFGKVASAVSEGEAGVRGAQAEVLLQIDNVATQTALAVVELSRFQALQAIASDQIKALEEVVRVTELRARLGASTRVDPVQARARVQAAQVYALQLQSQAGQWRARLLTLVARELPARLAPLPADRLEASLRTPAAPAEWPAVLVAQAQHQVALARLGGARAAALPTVTLQASVDRYLGGNSARNGDHGLYVAINSPAFQGGATAARERGAVRAVQAAESRVRAKQLEIDDKLKGLRERIDGLSGLREPLQQRQRSITETRALYREQYLSLGTRSALDLLNAEQEIAQAAFDAVQNQHDLWSAQVQFVEASGQTREVYGINHTRVQGWEVLP